MASGKKKASKKKLRVLVLPRKPRQVPAVPASTGVDFGKLLRRDTPQEPPELREWQRDFWKRDERDPPESYFDGSSKAGLVRPKDWKCQYGCPGIQVLGGTKKPHHVWNCPYWYREGRKKTPF